jgi:hypothetical protein
MLGLDVVNLTGVVANNQTIYESGDHQVSDLKAGEDIVLENLQTTDIKHLDSLSLSVDGSKSGLTFLIHVNILRRAVKQNTPVKIQVFGFIEEFKQLSGEPADIFSERVKKLIAENWGDESSQQQKLDQLESLFLAETNTLKHHLDELFPAFSELEDSQKMIRRNPMKSRYNSHCKRYDDSFAYLPIWMLYMDGAHGEAYYDENDDVVLDNEQPWDDSARYGAAGDGATWVDDMSNSSFGDSGASDGGASCSGGCGGGCGGA